MPRNPGAWFITKLISFAQVVLGPVYPYSAELWPKTPIIFCLGYWSFLLVLLFCSLGDDSFMQGTQVLVTWLDRGDCNRRNANTFYSMVQSVNAHVRRLLNEKATHDEELETIKQQFRDRLEGILRQCEYIGTRFRWDFQAVILYRCAKRKERREG